MSSTRIPRRARSWVGTVAVAWGVGAIALAQPAPPPADARDQVVAVIEGQPVRLEDLDHYLQGADPLTFTRLQQQLYDARRRALDELVGDRLLEREARRRGLSVDQLLAEALPELTQPVTETEIQEVYRRSPAATQGLTLEQARPALAAYLQQQKRGDARRRLVEKLRSAAGAAVTIRLEAPRQTVHIAPDDPAIGPETAPVAIVEFSDFQCPYCRRAVPVLRSLVTKFGDRVRLVWKDFPLPMHPAARPAAEAAQCAREQGKFWEYHDALFQDADNLEVADLKKRATAVGLELGAFERCLQSERPGAQVQADIQQGRMLGVGATPTVFINGRMIMGLAPLDTYERMVLEELARVK